MSVLQNQPQNQKQTYIIVIGVLVAIILAVIGWYFFLRETPILEEGKTPEQIQKDTQTQELEQLREEAGVKPLTEEDEQTQTQELEQLREDAGTGLLSEEEEQQQLDELEQLRQQANTL